MAGKKDETAVKKWALLCFDAFKPPSCEVPDVLSNRKEI